MADNKVSEKSGWDFELLDEELAEIVEFDMTDFGFEGDSDVNIDAFFEEKEQQEEKEKKHITCPHCGMPIEV